MVVMMNLMIMINTNMTNSQYDPPYHLGKTRLMMVHMMMIIIIINTNVAT